MGACDGIVHLRRARPDDARGIAEVHVETWRDAYRDLLPGQQLAALSVEAREKNWADELRLTPAGRRPWVADAQGRIVGFVTCGPARDNSAAAQTGEVYGLYVLSECWARGVGGSLLDHAVRDLVQHGYSEAVLWALVDDDRARAHYEIGGWTADGATKHDLIGGSEVAEVRYRLALEKSRVAELR